LVVERSNDQQLTPAALSKGTRDQLYLCIRVALAQELPDIDEGFFIMDDAFLSADPDRLDRQVALLDTLTAQGWQIIYLTAKPDAVDALRPHVDGAEISLDPLP
jgi:exonuclease SbcC